MADITIVNGVYKPTYNWGAPSCMDRISITDISLGIKLDPKMEVLYHIRPYFVGIFTYIGLI